jgi:YVTN family beta-propeller protein
MRKISRRALLISAAAAACGRRKGTGYPGHLFVAAAGGRSISAVDLTAFRLARQFPLEGAPSAVLAAPARRTVYGLVPESGMVCEIDAARLETRRRARINGPATAMRMAPDGGSLWVLEPRALVNIPFESFRPGHRIRLPAAAAGFDISRDGLLAAAFPDEGRAGFASPSAASIERLAPAGPAPSMIRFRGDGKLLLAANRAARTVTAIDVAAARVAVHLPLPLEPVHFCATPDGGQWFVSGPGRDAVAIIYPYTTEVAETILGGKAPGAMMCIGNPPYLFVANPSSGTVTVLDIDTRKLVAVMVVGQEPGEMLVTPDGQYAVVLNQRSGDAAVARVRSLRFDSQGKTRRYTAPPLFNLIPVGENPVSAVVV